MGSNMKSVWVARIEEDVGGAQPIFINNVMFVFGSRTNFLRTVVAATAAFPSIAAAEL